MGRNIWQYIAKMYEVFCTFLHASRRQKSMLTSNRVFLDSSHQGLSESVKTKQKYFFLLDLPRKFEKYPEKTVQPPGVAEGGRFHPQGSLYPKVTGSNPAEISHFFPE
jgi:hypothetical protein